MKQTQKFHSLNTNSSPNRTLQGRREGVDSHNGKRLASTPLLLRLRDRLPRAQDNDDQAPGSQDGDAATVPPRLVSVGVATGADDVRSRFFGKNVDNASLGLDLLTVNQAC